MVWGGNNSVLSNREISPRNSHFCGSISTPFWCCSPSSCAYPQPRCSISIYLSLPALCLPSFSQLIYGHCLSAPGHCSLNLAIICGSLQSPSICGASTQPDGLPSSSSIFPVVLVHPFGSGAAAHVPLVASALPALDTRSILTEAFCPGGKSCPVLSRRNQVGLPRPRIQAGLEVTGVRCTEKKCLVLL